MKLFSLKIFNQAQLDNLASYLDKYENGMLSIKDIFSAIQGRFNAEQEQPK